MNPTERLAVGAIATVLLFLVPASVLHSDQRFAGTLAGFALGAAAATLLLLLLIYPLIKYSSRLRAWITKVISLRALLTFHVYAGVFGAFLAILHTGHKYQSPLGIALVVSMLVAVATGFLGRYYLPLTTAELREAQSRLGAFRSAYDQRMDALATRAGSEDLSPTVAFSAVQGIPLRQIAGSITDLEYAVGAREGIKRLFTLWIVVHVVSAIVMYLLLTLHIAGEVYYGLRWLP
ncbi:MAG: iron reductase [Xanthobacteraceae bacterium]|nr:iron reductase [Xanthobacteraceae bacterium]